MNAQNDDSPNVRYVQARLTGAEFAVVRAKAGSGRGAMQKFARTAVLRALDIPAIDARIEISGENERPHALLAELLASRERKSAAEFLELLYDAAVDRKNVKGKLKKRA